MPGGSQNLERSTSASYAIGARELPDRTRLKVHPANSPVSNCGQQGKLIINAYEEQSDASLMYSPSFELDAPRVFCHHLVIERRQRRAPIQGLHREHADTMKQSWLMQWEVAMAFLMTTVRSEVRQQAQ